MDNLLRKSFNQLSLKFSGVFFAPKILISKLLGSHYASARKVDLNGFKVLKAHVFRYTQKS